MGYQHVSAMLSEAVSALNCRPGGTFVDCTLGGGGHARAIWESISPDGRLIGIDRDRAAVENAAKLFSSTGAHVQLFHGNFVQLPVFLSKLDISTVDGILLDLGLSQYQLEASGRGFSFQKDEPLDMRMDERSQKQAQDMVNQYSEEALQHIFKEYGEERWAKRIARAIVSQRRQAPIRTTGRLTEVIRSAVPGVAAKQKIHPATRVFMALRIAVNEELESLERFLDVALDLLSDHGRLCILSFHSLEDRIVKQRFKIWAQACTCPPEWPQCTCSGRPKALLITKKVMRPSAQEVTINPMARSTRLRALEKLPAV